MLEPPKFSTLDEYRKHLNDKLFWGPYIDEVLKRHDLQEVGLEPTSGVGGTYPTFLYGNKVIKLFGFFQAWEKSFEQEISIQKLVSDNSRILAPELIGSGSIFDDSWPYLIISKIPGLAWFDANLSMDEKLNVAGELGKQIKLIHSINPDIQIASPTIKELDIVSGARKSVLPDHLVDQVDSFVSNIELNGNVFVHSDLTARHVFVEDGQLSGIIDWGDGAVFDKHYELTKLHLDMFACNKKLLAEFLNTSNWPVEKDFKIRSLVMALYRQAIGLTQHFTFDAFHLVAKLYPLKEITSLEELANELFSV